MAFVLLSRVTSRNLTGDHRAIRLQERSVHSRQADVQVRQVHDRRRHLVRSVLDANRRQKAVVHEVICRLRARQNKSRCGRRGREAARVSRVLYSGPNTPKRFIRRTTSSFFSVSRISHKFTTKQRMRIQNSVGDLKRERISLNSHASEDIPARRPGGHAAPG